jgi:hypothetical protein
MFFEKRVRQTAAIALVVLLATASLRAETFESLRESFESAAKERGGQEKAVAQFAPRMIEFAETSSGKAEALPALIWLLQNARSIQHESGSNLAAWAVERLTRDHAGRPELREALPALRYVGFSVTPDALAALYERIVRENSDKAVKAAATFNLAQTLLVGGVAKPDAVDKTGQPYSHRRRAITLFRQLVREYPGTEEARNAEAALKGIMKIDIGNEAPDIVGPDADGKEIKLSQFLGQVVVLHFWGYW